MAGVRESPVFGNLAFEEVPRNSHIKELSVIVIVGPKEKMRPRKGVRKFKLTRGRKRTHKLARRSN